MNKKVWWIGVLLLFLLVGCGKKETKKEVEEPAVKETQVIKTQQFELDLTNGQKQLQTIVYQGEQLQKIILKNNIEITEEISKAISEVGMEETLRLLRESIAKDPAYVELDDISGLTYELESHANNELFFIFTMDVPQLDTDKLGKSDVFKGSGLADLKILTAEQYLKRLESYGARPVTP